MTMPKLHSVKKPLNACSACCFPFQTVDYCVKPVACASLEIAHTCFCCHSDGYFLTCNCGDDDRFGGIPRSSCGCCGMMCCPSCSCCPTLKDLYKDNEQLARLPDYKLDKRVCQGCCCPCCLKFCQASNQYFECHPQVMDYEMAYCCCCARDCTCPCFSGWSENVPGACGLCGLMCYPRCGCCPVMEEYYPDPEHWELDHAQQPTQQAVPKDQTQVEHSATK